MKWIVKVNGKLEPHDQEGEKVSIVMREEWKGKKITVMAYLDSPSERVCQVTEVVNLREIIEMRKEDGEEAIFDAKPFIKKLIECANDNAKHVTWLSNVLGITNPDITFGSRLDSGEGRLSNETLALATTSDDVFINLNHVFFNDTTKIDNGDVDNKELLAIIIHELRHVWQGKGDNWETISRQHGQLKSGRKTNIYAELDAYNIQFEFEKKDRGLS